jgi:type VI secretion system VasD/TssJ family lipoprotein
MLQRFSLLQRFALFAAVVALAACGGGGFLGIGGSDESEGPAKLCLELQASKDLNLFDGQPHVVVVHFYPLQNVTAFEASSVRDLIRGEKPAGLAGEPWQTTVLPGQKLRVGEQLPKDTAQIGVVADYYRGPSRVIASTTCESETGNVLVLSASEIAIQEAPKEDE